MTGTPQGGKKVRDKVLAKDPNYYKRLGAIGGSARVPKGFALMDKKKVSEAGIKGGTISRRGSKGMVDVAPDSQTKGFFRRWF